MFRTPGLLLCGLLSLGVARGQDADAEAVVKRAIDAAGGSETLKKFPAGRLSATGTLFPDDKTRIPVTTEQVLHMPGRSRIAIKIEAMGQTLNVMHVVNADKARYTINGSPVPITEAARQELIAAMTTLEVGQLLPLLGDRKFTLKVEKGGKFETDTVSVFVTARPGGDFRLGFDRTTGHLVRLTRRAYDAATGKTVDQEQLFSDFKNFEGIVRPTKVVVLQDGKKTLELIAQKYTPLTTVDAKEFATE